MTGCDAFRIASPRSGHCVLGCSCPALRPGAIHCRHCVGHAFRRPASCSVLSNPEPRSLFLQHATHNLELVFKQKGESKRLSSCITSGRYLLSHAVAHILPSARDGLTAGFGMEPGVSRPGIFTQNICSLKST